jgi:hypothetical protein
VVVRCGAGGVRPWRSAPGVAWQARRP